jgi:hypothetical protein
MHKKSLLPRTQWQDISKAVNEINGSLKGGKYNDQLSSSQGTSLDGAILFLMNNGWLQVRVYQYGREFGFLSAVKSKVARCYCVSCVTPDSNS